MRFEKESREVQWGVLGTARVARVVILPGIERSRNGKVLALASRSLEKARELSEQFSI